MKRLLSLSAALACVFAVGCTDKPVQPKFTSVQADTLFTSGSMQYSVQYDFASIANASQSAALQAIEESNIRSFFGLEDFTGTAQEATAAALEELWQEIQLTGESGYGWENTEAAQSEATVVDSLLVYTIARESYTGGAHGIYSLTVHNYSLAGGYELTLADLFDAGQRRALDSLVHVKLYEQFGVADDEGLAAEGFFPEYIAATENFAATPEGLTFYFNPYDIGCYALGAVEVSIDNEELENL